MKAVDIVITFKPDELERSILLRYALRQKPLQVIDRLGQVRKIVATDDGQYVVDSKQRFDTLKALKNFLKTAA